MEGGEWRFLFLDHVKAPGQGSRIPKGQKMLSPAGSPKLVPHQKPQAGLRVHPGMVGRLPRYPDIPRETKSFTHPPSFLSQPLPGLLLPGGLNT